MAAIGRKKKSGAARATSLFRSPIFCIGLKAHPRVRPSVRPSPPLQRSVSITLLPLRRVMLNCISVAPPRGDVRASHHRALLAFYSLDPLSPLRFFPPLLQSCLVSRGDEEKEDHQRASEQGSAIGREGKTWKCRSLFYILFVDDVTDDATVVALSLPPSPAARDGLRRGEGSVRFLPSLERERESRGRERDVVGRWSRSVERRDVVCFAGPSRISLGDVGVQCGNKMWDLSTERCSPLTHSLAGFAQDPFSTYVQLLLGYAAAGK